MFYRLYLRTCVTSHLETGKKRFAHVWYIFYILSLLLLWVFLMSSPSCTIRKSFSNPCCGSMSFNNYVVYIIINITESINLLQHNLRDDYTRLQSSLLPGHYCSLHGSPWIQSQCCCAAHTTPLGSFTPHSPLCLWWFQFEVSTFPTVSLHSSQAARWKHTQNKMCFIL